MGPVSGEQCRPAAVANESGRRSERCSARRPPTRFRGYQACYVGCVGRPRRPCTALRMSLRPRRPRTGRFAQSRRPATLLPSSRRAPRGCQKPCSVVRFGRENLLFRFCLGLAELPCPPLYYVMAITARVKSQSVSRRPQQTRVSRAATVVAGAVPVSRPDPVGGARRRFPCLGSARVTFPLRTRVKPAAVVSRVGGPRRLRVLGIHRKRRDFHRKIGGLNTSQVLAQLQVRVCIVRNTWPKPGVHQPDPPGLIHDDPRLLPPGGGRPISITNLIRIGFASSQTYSRFRNSNPTPPVVHRAVRPDWRKSATTFRVDRCRPIN